MSAESAAKGGTFIQAYDACKGYFEPMLAARNAVVGLGVESRKVPRAGHRYQTRGGSIGDRTTRSIAAPSRIARTAPVGASWGVHHA
jgi:hypothetical protein